MIMIIEIIEIRLTVKVTINKQTKMIYITLRRGNTLQTHTKEKSRKTLVNRDVRFSLISMLRIGKEDGDTNNNNKDSLQISIFYLATYI